MKIKDSEPKRTPNPIRNMNKPSSIGFLMYAYRPVMINFGGGLKGTGEPLVRTKAITGQAQMSQPRTKRTIAKPRLHQEESKWKNRNLLSTQVEARTKRATTMKNNSAIGSVIITFSFLLPVAIR